MSYLVLARKWRPQSFAEVVGQEHVTQTLQNAIKHNRIPHALLFCGPRGVGKTTVARLLAKSLNCEKGPTPEPCNQCVSCREVTQGTSLDVYEMDGASNRGIDEIREIRENVKYVPSRGRYKVYIIDEVHMLTKEAFNALLKTLEEPPSHVVFIFATTEPHKIPPTIVSRCQRFVFRRIGAPLLYQRLEFIAKQEKIEIADDAIWLIVRAAAGGLRDALSLLDQVISFSPPPIQADHVRAILGLFDTKLIIDVMQAVLNQNLKQVMEIVAQISEEGEDIKEFYNQLVAYWRHLVMLKLDPETSLVDLPDYELERLKKLSKLSTLSHLEQMFSILLNEEPFLRTTTQPRFVLEALLIRLTEFARIVPIEVILKRLGSLNPGVPLVKNVPEKEELEEQKTQLVEETERRPQPVRPQGDFPNALREKLVKTLRKESPILAAVLENAGLELKDGRLAVSLPKFHAELIQEKKLWQVFKKCCVETLGDNCKISIKTDDGNNSGIGNSRDSVNNQFDLLREVLKIFGGEVINSSKFVKEE
ncbi:MAG: DNA polymerase III subunit gamma/tau [Candidatus Desulfofervidaceae bacterium]|nr:DNA polymerase III subunit gamma/tau [Candidatus Desulfofervidaceae bacterium]